MSGFRRTALRDMRKLCARTSARPERALKTTSAQLTRARCAARTPRARPDETRNARKRPE
eukprot:724546-Lingulodinium_polyedra.AAC.1